MLSFGGDNGSPFKGETRSREAARPSFSGVGVVGGEMTGGGATGTSFGKAGGITGAAQGFAGCGGFMEGIEGIGGGVMPVRSCIALRC